MVLDPVWTRQERNSVNDVIMLSFSLGQDRRVFRGEHGAFQLRTSRLRNASETMLDPALHEATLALIWQSPSKEGTLICLFGELGRWG